MNRTRKQAPPATESRAEMLLRVQEAQTAAAEEIITTLFRQHKPYMAADRPGFGLHALEFFCEKCRYRWPCETFTLVCRYGQIGDMATAEFEPLKLTIKLPAGGEA